MVSSADGKSQINGLQGRNPLIEEKIPSVLRAIDKGYSAFYRELKFVDWAV
jgi:hypothetical protein